MSFLKDVKDQSKAGYLLLLIFAAIQITLSWKQTEITPFFHWGMYSKVMPESEFLYAYQIKLNGEILDINSLNDLEKQNIFSPLNYYGRLKKSDYQNPWLPLYQKIFPEEFVPRLTNNRSDESNFQLWLAKRVSDVCQCDFVTLEIVEMKCKFSNGRPIVVGEKSIEKFEDTELK